MPGGIPANLLALQQAAGNGAVVAALQRSCRSGHAGPPDPKLAKLKAEADRRQEKAAAKEAGQRVAGAKSDADEKVEQIDQQRDRAGRQLEKGVDRRGQIGQLALWLKADAVYLKEKEERHRDKRDLLQEQVATLRQQPPPAGASAAKKLQEQLAEADRRKTRAARKLNRTIPEAADAQSWRTDADQYVQDASGLEAAITENYEAATRVRAIARSERKVLKDEEVRAVVGQVGGSGPLLRRLESRWQHALAVADAARAAAKQMKAKRDALLGRKKAVSDEGRGEGKAKFVLKKAGAALAGVGTLGMVGVNVENKDGGYRSTQKAGFGPWMALKSLKTNLVDEIKRCNQIRKEKALGGAVGTMIFAVLRGIAQVVIKPIRDLLGIISGITTALGFLIGTFFPPLGAVLLSIATVTASLAIKLSIIKGMINAVLTAWSVIAALANDDVRDRMAARREAKAQGMETGVEAARVAVPAGVNVGSTISSSYDVVRGADVFSPVSEGKTLGGLSDTWNKPLNSSTSSSLGNNWLEAPTGGQSNKAVITGGWEGPATGGKNQYLTNFGFAGDTPLAPGAMDDARGVVDARSPQATLDRALRRQHAADRKKAAKQARSKLGELLGTAAPAVNDGQRLRQESDASVSQASAGSQKLGEDASETSDAANAIRGGGSEASGGVDDLAQAGKAAIDPVDAVLAEPDPQ